MTYRHQIFRNLKFGTLAAFVGAQEKKNALLSEAGLTPYRIWAPAFGGLHHLVLEAEFPSMAEFERQHGMTKQLAGMAELNATQLECVLEGSARDQLQRLSLDAG